MKKGWEYKRINEVFDLQMGKTPDRKTPQYFEGDNVWVSIRDMGSKEISDSNEHISDEAIIASNIRKVKKGTVIMSFKLTVGKCAIAAKDLYTNEAIMAFNLKEGYNVSSDFLYFYLRAYKWNGANKAVMGMTLNKATISQHKIGIPPLSEQQRIVEELDLLSSIIEKKKAQLKELDSLAQSIFYDMFGDPVTNEKGWEVKKLGDLSEIIRGGSPRPIVNFLGGNIPWIKIGDATSGNDIYLNGTREYIIKEGLSKTRFIPSGSLIFANCGVSLGFARIITFAGCIHDGWLAFMNINSDYLNKLFFLKSLNMCTVFFRNTAPDGTQPNLNTAIMKSFKQILPPLPLQQQFAEKIEAIEHQKELIKQSIKEVETLFNSRMDYYFS
jgi:restriction endonuclease S subunit